MGCISLGLLGVAPLWGYVYAYVLALFPCPILASTSTQPVAGSPSSKRVRFEAAKGLV